MEEEEEEEEEDEEEDDEDEEEEEVVAMVVAEDIALATVSVFIITAAPSLSTTFPLFLSRFRFALLDDDLSFAIISIFTDVSDLPSPTPSV